MKTLLAAAAAALVAAACTTAPKTSVPPQALAQLAPHGKLRAGMNTGNTLFTTKDAKGALQGVSVDLMRELGRRLGVPVEFVVYATPGEVADDAASGKWDVAILAIEQTRAEKIAFSPAITEIEASYLVPGDSRLRRVEEVDAPGVRIAVSEKAGYDGYLTRTLRQAKIERAKGIPATFEMFRREKLDAMAGLKPVLLEYADRMPGARVTEGRFMTVNHGIGTPRGHQAGAEWVKGFVAEMVASGFVARSIERHQVRGLGAIRP